MNIRLSKKSIYRFVNVVKDRENFVGHPQQSFETHPRGSNELLILIKGVMDTSPAPWPAASTTFPTANAALCC